MTFLYFLLTSELRIGSEFDEKHVLFYRFIKRLNTRFCSSAEVLECLRITHPDLQVALITKFIEAHKNNDTVIISSLVKSMLQFMEMKEVMDLLAPFMLSNTNSKLNFVFYVLKS